MRAEKVKQLPFVAKYIHLDVGVRYWEDASINGEPDEYGEIPFRFGVPDEHGNVPIRFGDRWKPVIDFNTGEVIGWPKEDNITAEIHYKVCDDGIYTLTDAELTKMAVLEDYVPEFLDIGDNGFGDYIIMTIGSDGFIHNWKMPEINMEEWEFFTDKTETPIESDLDYALGLLADLIKEEIDLELAKRLTLSRFPDHKTTKLLNE